MRRFLDDRSRNVWKGLVIASAIGCSVFFAQKSAAQDHTQLLTLLSRPGDFRVRVQAALAIGNLKDPALIPSLTRALDDTNPAVRAAAVIALEHIGDPSAETALHAALEDSSNAVRRQAQHALEALAAVRASETGAPETDRPAPAELNPSTRWIVHVGDMQNRSEVSEEDVAARLREEVVRNLRSLDGIAVFAETQDQQDQNDGNTHRVGRRVLPELRVDGTVLRIHRELRGASVAIRCEVSVMFVDAPSRSIRAALSGTATGMQQASSMSAARERTLTRDTLVAAIRSAMSRAPSALTMSPDAVAMRH